MREARGGEGLGSGSSCAPRPASVRAACRGVAREDHVTGNAGAFRRQVTEVQDLKIETGFTRKCFTIGPIPSIFTRVRARRVFLLDEKTPGGRHQDALYTPRTARFRRVVPAKMAKGTYPPTRDNADVAARGAPSPFVATDDRVSVSGISPRDATSALLTRAPSHPVVPTEDAKAKAAKAAKAVKKGGSKVKLLKKRFSPVFHRCASSPPSPSRAFPAPRTAVRERHG